MPRPIDKRSLILGMAIVLLVWASTRLAIELYRYTTPATLIQLEMAPSCVQDRLRILTRPDSLPTIHQLHQAQRWCTRQSILRFEGLATPRQGHYPVPPPKSFHGFPSALPAKPQP